MESTKTDGPEKQVVPFKKTVQNAQAEKGISQPSYIRIGEFGYIDQRKSIEQ